MILLYVLIVFTFVAGLLSAGLVVVYQARRRNLHQWLGTYVRERARRSAPAAEQEVHVLLCFADHWEPKGDQASVARARARVARWVNDYPRLFQEFRDSDSRTPRHTFFYPIEEYEPDYLDALTSLCRRGFGEVEVHLHHDNDTAENLRKTLLDFKEMLATRHGLLARQRASGELVYGFIHGNWALDNSLPDGRHCGVPNELSILRETGCYADFTLPSVPSAAQTARINSIYYAEGVPGRCKSHNAGIDAGTGPVPPEALMLIQGPLLLDWRHRKWGMVPHLENGCLQASQWPTLERLDLWLKARVQVAARPDWFFVKLHMHGAQEADFTTLLGDPMRQFHQALANRALENPRFHYHYVTAREMYNLARAAAAGWKGSVLEALDYEVVSNLTTGCAPADSVLEFTTQGSPPWPTPESKDQCAPELTTCLRPAS